MTTNELNKLPIIPIMKKLTDNDIFHAFSIGGQLIHSITKVMDLKLIHEAKKHTSDRPGRP